MYETIQFEVDRGVGVLTLNRPRVLNAISGKMIEEIMDLQSRVERDPEVNVLVLAGAGRSFCAGYDLKEADAGAEEDPAAPDLLDARHRLELCCDMTMGFWHCRKPTVSAVHGHCLAGGCELALACDITIASEDALFGEPELRFGAGIVCLILPWLTGPKQAKELIFTGNDRIPAERALAMGLVNRVVPEGEARGGGDGDGAPDRGHGRARDGPQQDRHQPHLRDHGPARVVALRGGPRRRDHLPRHAGPPALPRDLPPGGAQGGARMARRTLRSGDMKAEAPGGGSAPGSLPW